jgi:hypothetical protein
MRQSRYKWVNCSMRRDGAFATQGTAAEGKNDPGRSQQAEGSGFGNGACQGGDGYVIQG